MADPQPEPVPGAEVLLPGDDVAPRFAEEEDAEAYAVSTLLADSEQPAEGDGAADSTALPDWLPTVSVEDVRSKTASAPPAAPKESQVKISCPNCGSPGSLPWGRLDKVLCCSHCWHWFRLASHGKLEEVPAPKEFTNGTLRVQKGNGQIRVVEVTPDEIKRKRRQVWKESRISALKDLNVSDNLVLGLAAAWMVGLSIFLFSSVFAFNRPPGVPNSPPPGVREVIAQPRTNNRPRRSPPSARAPRGPRRVQPDPRNSNP